jgi:hypothetical protein
MVPPTMAPVGELLIVVTADAEAADGARPPEVTEEGLGVFEEGVDAFVT